MERHRGDAPDREGDLGVPLQPGGRPTGTNHGGVHPRVSVDRPDSPPESPLVTGRFNEEEFLSELRTHLEKTYDEHYIQGDRQVIENVMDGMNSLEFLTGTVQTYIARYGKKQGYNKADLFKAVHFILFMWYYTDKLGLDKE